MTYIDYMNQFWRVAEQEPFPASEVALFAFLVNECMLLSPQQRSQPLKMEASS